MMKVLVGEPINAFNSTNVSLTESVYAAGTTYSVGDRVYWYPDTNPTQSDLGPTFVFESLQDSNTGNDPYDSPTFWAKVGPTNRWAMRDSYSGIWTEVDSDITVAFTHGAAPLELQVKSIGAVFCVGESITVSVTAADSMLVWDGSAWNETAFSAPSPIVVELDNELQATNSATWAQYFGDYQKGWTRTKLIDLVNIYVNPTISVTIAQGSSYRAVCGVLTWGYGAILGDTEWGVTVGIRDYSKKEVNDFGVVEFVKRPYAPILTANIEAVEEAVDEAVKAMGTWRATPALWDFNPENATDPYEALIIFGHYTDISVEFVDVEHRRISVEVEGAI